jgi:hypothetical protein
MLVGLLRLLFIQFRFYSANFCGQSLLRLSRELADSPRRSDIRHFISQNQHWDLIVVMSPPPLATNVAEERLILLPVQDSASNFSKERILNNVLIPKDCTVHFSFKDCKNIRGGNYYI